MDTHGTLTEFEPLRGPNAGPKKKVDGTACFVNFMTQPTVQDLLLADSSYQDELKALSNKLQTLRSNPARSGGARLEWENERIPSGYTYLAQFVAHDVVFTALSRGRVTDQCDRFHNHRSSALNLDTLYGAHPRVARHAYQTGGSGDQFRTRLSLGPMEFVSAQKPPKPGPLRDIGRAITNGGKYPTEICLADTRNDNNAVLSQLTTLFSHLHNGIVTRLEPNRCASDLSNALAHQERIYLEARELVTYIYLDIIEHDLLKRLLSPEVYAFYSRDSVGFLHKKHDRIPLEFSHAVLRCGHSMVRHRYFMGKRFEHPESQHATISFNSSISPWSMPFNQKWIIDWADFFDMGAVPPRNLSGRFEPAFSGDITPGVVASQSRTTLPLSDLMRSARSNLWSVDALLKKVSAKRARLFKVSKFYSGNINAYKKPLREWLNQLGGDDFNQVAENPPLSLYVLFEAKAEHNGEHIGTLGSIIIADVLFAAIKARRNELDLAKNQKLMREVLSCEQLNDMPSLIRTVAQFVDDADGALPLYSLPTEQALS